MLATRAIPIHPLQHMGFRLSDWMTAIMCRSDPPKALRHSVAPELRPVARCIPTETHPKAGP